MNSELESRLREDLPRLALMLVDTPVFESATTAPLLRRRRPMRAAVLASCLVFGVTLAIVAITTHQDGARPPTTNVVAAQGSWQTVARSPLGPRGGVNPVWTGTEVLVWGGNRGILFLQDGAAYNPSTQSWRSIASNQWAFPSTISVWAGDRFVVLAKDGGATYAPSTNTWQDLPFLRDSVNGSFLGVVWSGHDILALAQHRGSISVARYDSSTDSWVLGKAQQATIPPDSAQASVAWTGTELVYWNGTNQGWAYTPTEQTWRKLPRTANRPGSASSLTEIDGRLVVAYPTTKSNQRLLVVAQLSARAWRTITTIPAMHNTQPGLVAADHAVIIIDRSGRASPIQVTPTSGKHAVLNGYPLNPGTGTAAVWTNTGLFVWGGNHSATPPDGPDAAWHTPTP
jgi:hypothetical protein